MSDDDHRSLVRAGGNLPARVAPRPAIPSLPSSSGAIFGSRTRILRKDREFLEADAARLAAQKIQTDNFTALVESRAAAALALARLHALPEIAQHEYDRGRVHRQAEKDTWQHQARIAAIDHEREEINATADLVRAQQRLADLQPAPPPAPEPPPAPPAPAPAGLSPEDVEDALTSIPEIGPDTVKTVSRILLGMLREKRS